MTFKPRILGICLAALAVHIISEPLMAQTKRHSMERIDLLFNGLQAVFQPPDGGAPDNTGNGSSRNEYRCPDDQVAMRPLLPDSGYGLTFQERPEIFVEISETSAQTALLVFRSTTGTFYYDAQLPIQAIDGIARFQLPEEAPALEPNQTYQWALSFICNEHFSLNDPTITGWVNRQVLSADTKQTIATYRNDEHIQWLGENGYWYDLVRLWYDLNHLHQVDSKLNSET